MAELNGRFVIVQRVSLIKLHVYLHVFEVWSFLGSTEPKVIVG